MQAASNLSLHVIHRSSTTVLLLAIKATSFEICIFLLQKINNKKAKFVLGFIKFLIMLCFLVCFCCCCCCWILLLFLRVCYFLFCFVSVDAIHTTHRMYRSNSIKVNVVSDVDGDETHTHKNMITMQQKFPSLASSPLCNILILLIIIILRTRNGHFMSR